MKTCPTCAGTRGYDSIGTEPCPDCVGTGRDLKSDLWSEPCRFCQGNKYITYTRWNKCVTCNGLGSVS